MSVDLFRVVYVPEDGTHFSAETVERLAETLVKRGLATDPREGELEDEDEVVRVDLTADGPLLASALDNGVDGWWLSVVAYADPIVRQRADYGAGEDSALQTRLAVYLSGGMNDPSGYAPELSEECPELLDVIADVTGFEAEEAELSR